MLHHQDGDAKHVADVANPGTDVVGLLYVQAGRGLVEQQQLGRNRQRPPQFHHLAHPVGKAAHGAFPDHVEAEEVDDLLDPAARLDLGAVERRQAQDLVPQIGGHMDVAPDQDVLQHIGVVEQFNILEGARNAQPGNLVGHDTGDVAAFKMDAAGGRVIDAADQVEDGRLAGAIGPDDGEDAALLDFERHAVYRADSAKVHCKIAYREKAHGGVLSA